MDFLTVKHKLNSLCVGVLLIISGCSSSLNVSSITSVFSVGHLPSKALYLRGNMSFWDAVPEYRFARDGSNTLSVNIELFADGQAYEFKIADHDWSAKFNCGSKKSSKEISVAETAALFCGGNSHNLTFLPRRSGVYNIRLKAEGQDNMTVLISLQS